MEQAGKKEVEIADSTGVYTAVQSVKKMTAAIGFDDKEQAEIALAVKELASNIVKHAKFGTIFLQPLTDFSNAGIQIESIDWGPGIVDLEQAMTDGFSTKGSLGYGLGTVNRVMDEFEIRSEDNEGRGTHIICKRWKRVHEKHKSICPLSFGAATRPRPDMNVNGDEFIIQQWNESALVSVIDGLGHGQFAHRAAQKARQYIESHFRLPLDELFRGVARNCYATRGIVMALARFDWTEEKMTFASVGNIEARVFGSPEPVNFIFRRGIVGVNAPNPIVTEHTWNQNNIMVLHSDGIRTHWKWEDFSYLTDQSASTIAQKLLITLAKETDDATVVVVKGNS